MTDREEEVRCLLQDLFERSRQRLVGHRVILFGSRARGDARTRSDFDLAVTGPSPLPLADFYALADQIEALPTLYRFDWVDLARTGTRFRESALEHAEVLLEA